MKLFILTPRAEQDVSDIWDYIAEDSIEADDRVLAALEKSMCSLATIQASVIFARNWLTAATASFWFMLTLLFIDTTASPWFRATGGRLLRSHYR